MEIKQQVVQICQYHSFFHSAQTTPIFKLCNPNKKKKKTSKMCCSKVPSEASASRQRRRPSALLTHRIGGYHLPRTALLDCTHSVESVSLGGLFLVVKLTPPPRFGSRVQTEITERRLDDSHPAASHNLSLPTSFTHVGAHNV